MDASSPETRIGACHDDGLACEVGLGEGRGLKELSPEELGFAGHCVDLFKEDPNVRWQEIWLVQLRLWKLRMRYVCKNFREKIADTHTLISL